MKAPKKSHLKTLSKTAPLCGVFLFISSAYAAPVAMLTGVKGTVQVVHGGATSPGKNGTSLEAGDSVRVGAGGSATIYYAHRPPQSLGANQQVQVAAPGATPAVPSVWSNVYKGVAAGFARRGEKVGATVRPGFASDQIALLSPVNSRVLQRPVLVWALDNVAAGGDFHVRISDTNGREVWNGSTKETRIEIPAQIALQSGVKYSWVVTPREVEAGQPVTIDEKRSINAWFEIASIEDAKAVRQEGLEIATALQGESEGTRRAAASAALAERGFASEAISLLTQNTLESEIAKSGVRPALAKHDAAVVALNDAARWQLRRLYLDTKQSELAVRVVPEEVALANDNQAAANNQVIAAVPSGAVAVPTAPVVVQANSTPTASAFHRIALVDYADPFGTFALRVPAEWKIKRQPFAGGGYTTFKTGGDFDPMFSVITLPFKERLASDLLETLGPKWIGMMVDLLKQTGQVEVAPTQTTKFQGRSAVRADLTITTPQTGTQRGYLAVILGVHNSFMIGVTAPPDRQNEIARLEEVLQSLSIESSKPGAGAGEIGVNLGAFEEAFKNSPPALREAMAESEALLRIRDEVINQPLVGYDSQGKPLNADAIREKFAELYAYSLKQKENSLQRWRALRELAVLANLRGWHSYDVKNAVQAAAWFALHKDFSKASTRAVTGYFSRQFTATQQQVAQLEARVPVQGELSDDRTLLSMLHQLQADRSILLSDVSLWSSKLARSPATYQDVEHWAKISIDMLRRAQQYAQAEPQNTPDAVKLQQQSQINIAAGLESIGWAQWQTGRIEEAEKSCLQALELRRSVPITLVERYPQIALRQLGVMRHYMGDYQVARSYFEQAWQEMENARPARAAKRAASDSPAYRELLLVSATEEQISTLSELSSVFSSQGNYKTAESYLQQALNELNALPATPRGTASSLYYRADLLSSLGALKATTGDTNGALRDFDASSRLWREQGYSREAGSVLLTTSVLYQELGKMAEAQARRSQARQLYVLAQNLEGLLLVNILEAREAREQGRLDEAAAHAQVSLNLARQDSSATSIGIAVIELGAVRLEQNRFDEAEILFSEAALIDARTGSPSDASRTLKWQGNLLVKRGQPLAALERYKRAIELIERVRATTRSEAGFSDRKNIYEVYERTVSLLIKLGRATEAFDYLSRAKSKRLQDALRLANFKSGDAMLQTQLERAAGLQSKTQAINKAIQTEKSLPSNERNDQKIVALQTRLGAVQEEWKELSKQIETARPKLLNNAPSSLSEMQKQIPADAILVQWAPVGEELYAFTVTRDEVKAQVLPEPAAKVWAGVREFRRLTDEARRRTANGESIAVTNWLSDDPNVAPLRENLLSLRAMLIAPLEAQIASKKTVVFVPNGLLYYLPLHALAKREGNGIKFFGQEKQVATLAAADVLAVLQKTPTRSSGLLALGNPEGAALPGAGEEARALGKIFPAAQVLTGAQATKDAVLTPQNENRRIWHLATHGVLNSAAPDKSYIQLAPGQHEGDEELTVGEVYSLDLKQTDLVTLSACQTAIGERNPDGIEITSLATSFARAGADSVLASLWSVSDDSTRDFMTEFYKRLAAGESKAMALQGAQAKLLSDPKFNHPFYWAPFVLMGDWR